MEIAKITGPGLAATALSVVALWGCFVGEQVLVRRARVENARVIYQLRQMQRERDRQPASLPLANPQKAPRPSAS